MGKIKVRGRVYFSKLFYYGLGALILLLAFGQFNTQFFRIGLLALGLFSALLLLEIILLFLNGDKNFTAQRKIDDRFSNGDENTVQLSFTNQYHFPVATTIADEIPQQFQKRDFNLELKFKSGESKIVTSTLVTMLGVAFVL